MSKKNNYMTFWEHLDELRKRIIYSLLSIFVFSLAAYFWSENIKLFLMNPILEIVAKTENSTLAYLSPQAPFMLYLSISLF